MFTSILPRPLTILVLLLLPWENVTKQYNSSSEAYSSKKAPLDRTIIVRLPREGTSGRRFTSLDTTPRLPHNLSEHGRLARKPGIKTCLWRQKLWSLLHVRITIWASSTRRYLCIRLPAKSRRPCSESEMPIQLTSSTDWVLRTSRYIKMTKHFDSFCRLSKSTSPLPARI